jgi:hypothetical protein
MHLSYRFCGESSSSRGGGRIVGSTEPFTLAAVCFERAVRAESSSAWLMMRLQNVVWRSCDACQKDPEYSRPPAAGEPLSRPWSHVAGWRAQAYYDHA